MSFDSHGRIKCGTVSTPDLEAALADYRDRLGLRLVEQGEVAGELAASWGARASAGQAYALLQPRSGAECFLRLIEAPLHDAFVPTRTFGWAAFELTVKDVYGLAERVEGSGFEIVGPPKPIDGLPYFVPMQVLGRGREMLYFNQVAMDTPSSDLPKAQSEVDHIFIVILATSDRVGTLDHLKTRLKLEEGGSYTLNYTMINSAFGLPDGTQSTITMVQNGRLPIVEVDGYPPAATARPKLAGMLPPGNAMVTLAADSLGRVDLDWIAPPVERPGPLYKGRRSATALGSAGELIEVIEVG
jgi:catechol 2,3-dioxygenase-like lactoylglutathione lyase family enzyme